MRRWVSLTDGSSQNFSQYTIVLTLLLFICLVSVFVTEPNFDSHFHACESGLFSPHLGILELKSQKRFWPLSFVSVFFLSVVKLEPVFLSVCLVISSSVCLCALPSFFIYVNKAASGAGKWWKHSRAYRRAVCLQYIIESAQLKG